MAEGDRVSGGVFTVTAACAGCGACLRTCPEHAIRPAAPGAPAPLVVLPHCSGCGECAEVCPVEACVEVAAELPGLPSAPDTRTGTSGALA